MAELAVTAAPLPPQPTHSELMDRMGDIETKFDVFMAEMRADMKAVKEDVAETKEIVAAFEAAKAWGKFVKWASGVAAGLGVLWVVIKAAAMEALK